MAPFFSVQILFFTHSSSLWVTEGSFVILDHSGIGTIETIPFVEKAEFTIYIHSDGVPKVTWFKDDHVLNSNYIITTKTTLLGDRR